MNRRMRTRINLDHRGIDLDSVRCPMCDDDLETEDHVFVTCTIAAGVWKQVLKWWKISNVPIGTLMDVIQLADNAPIASNHSKFLDVVVQTTIWSIWKFRNDMAFSHVRPRKDLLLNDIKLMSYNWISSR
ncbi:RNA-directed DNA polymerase, eukaryota, reverse transcriptase zinc-binding domain protein, partial [Tanacetum coccineum]